MKAASVVAVRPHAHGSPPLRPELVLTRLDQVRALADPLRFRLVQSLAAREASVAELARTLGAPLTRLYHHVDLLLEAGLIEVASQVRRRGAVERRFRATAGRFTLDKSLLEMSPGPDQSAEELVALGRGILEAAREDLLEGFKAGRVRPGEKGRGLLLQDRLMRLSAEGFARLARELPALLDALEAKHGAPRGPALRLALAAFPSGYDPKPKPASRAGSKRAKRK